MIRTAMAADGFGQAAGHVPRKAEAGLARRFFGVLWAPRTYGNLLYLLLGLPIGITTFSIVVTVVTTGLGLAITIIGLPILVAAMYGWRLLADGDRALTNALLGTAVPPVGQAGSGSCWSQARVAAALRDPLTWRALAWTLLRLVHGTATFVAAVTLVSVGFYGLAALVFFPVGEGLDFYSWRIDTLGEALLVGVPAPFVIVLALHATNVLAYWSGRFTNLMLGAGRELPADGRVSLEWISDVTRAVDSGWVRTRRVLRQALLPHFVVFVVVVLFFAAVNVLANYSGPDGDATPRVWWFLWVVWGFSFLLAIHAGLAWRGFLGAHALLYASLVAGFIWMDVVYAQNGWSGWAAVGLGLVLATHAALAWSIPRARRRGNAAATALARTRRDATDDGVLDARAAVTGHAAVAGGDEVSPRPATAPPAGISVDVVMRAVTVDGRPVELTPKEYDLLVLLVQNPGRPFNRGELLDRVWRNDYEVTERTVDACVVRLRRKLGEQAKAIQTVWGVGYRYQRDKSGPA
jgi:hypothetical protein